MRITSDKRAGKQSIPSLRGELPLLSSLSSFCEEGAGTVESFMGWTDCELGCVSCFELNGGEVRKLAIWRQSQLTAPYEERIQAFLCDA